MPLTDPQGRPLGNPVVAHIITMAGRRSDAELTALGQLWQDMFGIPCILLTDGIGVLGTVLSDGQLVELPLAPELSARVQEVLRVRENGAGDGS